MDGEHDIGGWAPRGGGVHVSPELAAAHSVHRQLHGAAGSALSQVWDDNLGISTGIAMSEQSEEMT